jgi:hypothetical protein
VYARCRPMAKYELEKGCKSVVEIKDENSMKVITSRGDKEFEFDAVFGMDSTQDQVRVQMARLLCCSSQLVVVFLPHLYVGLIAVCPALLPSAVGGAYVP